VCRRHSEEEDLTNCENSPWISQSENKQIESSRLKERSQEDKEDCCFIPAQHFRNARTSAL
jgi:hypothetical protein